VLKIVRESKAFFIVSTTSAFVLRLIFIFRFPSVTTDSFIYGDIAKNWLQRGIYGISNAGSGIEPTCIRLPGYPAFLAAIFSIFGMDHYRPVLVVQMFVDVGTCFLVAEIARRVFGRGAARAAFLLAALCPFTANYVATALTETLEIFFTALSLNFALAGFECDGVRKIAHWIGCGLATAATILLRPDGGILLAAIEFFLVWAVAQRLRYRLRVVGFVGAMFVVGIVSIAPLIPWTLRNLHTLNRFQPLAPRYANDESEFVPVGFNRWVKTWIVDYASVEEIYWPVPGELVDTAKLPDRAFDSVKQRWETLQLLSQYNSALYVSPELDARFAGLAAQRISKSPLRYYVWLPTLRIADMWFRPRTEMLPSDSRWWEFNDDPKWSVLAVGLGLIGIFYAASGLAGFFQTGVLRHAGLLATFVVLRSLFLGTLENPEPRYTLECFPVVIVFAAAAFHASRTGINLPTELRQRGIGHSEPGSNVFGE
jgi:4-amino-4-deoxy-L-arabinose transferase-like glycosyltransferase